MSEEQLVEQKEVAQPEVGPIDPLILELEKLKEPKKWSGMKAFSSLQLKYFTDYIKFTNRQTEIIATINAKARITNSIERVAYIVPRTLEGLKEFMVFANAVIEEQEKQNQVAQEKADEQKNVSGTPDSTDKE